MILSVLLGIRFCTDVKYFNFFVLKFLCQVSVFFAVSLLEQVHFGEATGSLCFGLRMTEPMGSQSGSLPRESVKLKLLPLTLSWNLYQTLIFFLN